MINPKKWIQLTIISGLLLALAGCATDYTQRTQQRLARYQAAAAEPVKSVRYFRLYSWTPVDDTYLVIWTQFNKPYLLKVRGPCNDLQFANAIGLTSNINAIYARFDSVILENYRCRIDEIRPIDYAKLKDLEKAADEQRKSIRAQPREDQVAGESGSGD